MSSVYPSSPYTSVLGESDDQQSLNARVKGWALQSVAITGPEGTEEQDVSIKRGMELLCTSCA